LGFLMRSSALYLVDRLILQISAKGRGLSAPTVCKKDSTSCNMRGIQGEEENT